MTSEPTTTSRPTMTPEPIKVPPPGIGIFDTPKSEKKKNQSNKYQVQVREKGIFRTVKVTSSPKEAFIFGKQKVEQSASASFRVKAAGSSENIRASLPGASFYESKKEPGLFIQRREKRISTAGEKREITFKGILSQRQRGFSFGRL